MSCGAWILWGCLVVAGIMSKGLWYTFYVGQNCCGLELHHRLSAWGRVSYFCNLLYKGEGITIGNENWRQNLMFLFLGDVRLAKMSVLIGTGPYKLLKKDPKVHERRLHSDNINRDNGIKIPEAYGYQWSRNNRRLLQQQTAKGITWSLQTSSKTRTHWNKIEISYRIRMLWYKW